MEGSDEWKDESEEYESCGDGIGGVLGLPLRPAGGVVGQDGTLLTFAPSCHEISNK
jgi:hypothetical protein